MDQCTVLVVGAEATRLQTLLDDADRQGSVATGNVRRIGMRASERVQRLDRAPSLRTDRTPSISIGESEWPDIVRRLQHVSTAVNVEDTW